MSKHFDRERSEYDAANEYSKTRELFKCTFGSHLYGTSTPASDKDWKIVYLPSLTSCLRGYSLRNTSENTSSSKQKNTAEDVDVEKIPLQVFIDSFVKGQTFALEIAFASLDSSNVEKEIYDGLFRKLCEDLTTYYLTSNVSSMVGYCYAQAQKYGVKGKRLASVLALTKILQEYDIGDIKLRSVPPCAITKVFNDGDVKHVQYQKTQTLKDDAYDVLGKIYPFDITVSEALGRLKKTANEYGHRTEKAMDSDGIDWKAMYHALRVCYQATDILEKGMLVFPFTGVRQERLMEVRSGEASIDSVQEEIEQSLNEIARLQQSTTLKQRNDEFDQEFQLYKDEWLIRFYNLNWEPVIWLSEVGDPHQGHFATDGEILDASFGQRKTKSDYGVLYGACVDGGGGHPFYARRQDFDK